MSPIEQKIYYPLAKARTAIFKPINKILTTVGIKPDMLSFLGVLLMVGFALSLPEHPTTAFWFLVGRIVADIMDGPLARYQKNDTDRGKFVDVVMDNLAFAIFIFGVIHAGLMTGVVGAAFLFTAEAVVVLMIIKHNLEHKSDWLFFASAGSYPYNFMYLVYLVFAIGAFGHSNYLNGVAKISIIFLAFKAAQEYWYLQKFKVKKS